MDIKMRQSNYNGWGSCLPFRTARRNHDGKNSQKQELAQHSWKTPNLVLAVVNSRGLRSQSTLQSMLSAEAAEAGLWI